MSESVRHRGTEPPNPHDAAPGQERPLGEWNKLSDLEDAREEQEEQEQREQREPREPD